MLKQTCSNCQILTKKPLINLLHTTMFLILFIYYDCTRNYSPWRLDANLMVFFFNWQVMTAVLLFLLWLIGPSINPIRQGIQCSLVFWIPLRGLRVPGTLYLIPDLCHWNLDSRFQSSVGFWIPNPRVLGFFPPPPPPPPRPKEKNNNFVDSLTWGDLMFKEVLKCLRADRTKHVIGPIERMLMTSIVPEAM